MGWKARYSYRLVSWEKSIQGHCKLNTNGCSLDNPSLSGRGGILRDSSGALLLGFSILFGVLTSV